MEKIAKQISIYFPPDIKKTVENIMGQHHDSLEEIRVRANKPLSFLIKGKECSFPTEMVYVKKDQLEKIFHMLTNYSYYSVEQELQNGYITIPGGHRIGICGKAVMEKGRVKTLTDISSLNFRVARQKKEIGERVLKYVIDNGEFLSTIILSPPNCGKTTLLRDMVRNLAGDSKFNFKVGVVDERSEIAGCYRGIPQLDLGQRVDVLDNCPKKDGMIMLIRSMSPDIVATDELGKKEDIEALEYAITAGVKVLTTVHGKDIEDLKNKPYFDQILKLKLFKRVIVLSNRKGVGTIEDVFDLSLGKSVKEGKYYVV